MFKMFSWRLMGEIKNSFVTCCVKWGNLLVHICHVPPRSVIAALTSFKRYFQIHLKCMLLAGHFVPDNKGPQFVFFPWYSVEFDVSHLNNFFQQKMTLK